MSIKMDNKSPIDQEILLKAYNDMIKRRQYAIEYSRRYRKENRDKVNLYQRELYARKKSSKQIIESK